MRFNLIHECVHIILYACNRNVYMYKLKETQYVIFMLPFVLGAHATCGIITRLPYGQNNLGISEPTTIALLCTLMEVCVDSPDNAR